MTDASHPDPAQSSQIPASDASQEERTLAMLSHVGPILLALVSAGGLGWAVPLVIYLVKRDESAFVADQAVESLNFHITVALGCVVAGISVLTIVLIPLALLFFLCIGLVGIILGIMAGLAASKGERYRYPLTLRLVRP